MTAKEQQKKSNSEIIARLGVIFAFSTTQFNESKKEGVKYVNMGAGMICPKENQAELRAGLAEQWTAFLKQDKEERTKETIIESCLSNYECFYTGDIEDAWGELEDYGYTQEEVMTVLRERAHAYE